MSSRVANIKNVFNGVVDQLMAQPGRKYGDMCIPYGGRYQQVPVPWATYGYRRYRTYGYRRYRTYGIH